MKRFFGLVTVRRRGATEFDGELEPEPDVKVVSTDRARPLGLTAPESAAEKFDLLPEITRLAAEELKRKTEVEPAPAAALEPAAAKVKMPPAAETRWQRAGRLRAMGMREERIAADLGVLTSDLRLRWKLESLLAGR